MDEDKKKYFVTDDDGVKKMLEDGQKGKKRKTNTKAKKGEQNIKKFLTNNPENSFSEDAKN